MSATRNIRQSSDFARHSRPSERLHQRAERRLRGPVERFSAAEVASGILLFLATFVASTWVDPAWSDGCRKIREAAASFSIGALTLSVTPHVIVNDVLMTLFFLVVGLEIRRELASGELSGSKRAALAVIAVVGGLLVPAAIHASNARGGDAGRGWGVPKATDFAFVLGILALPVRRVPPALRILLLATAIIVIADFSSSGAGLPGLAMAGAGIAGLCTLQRSRGRAGWPFRLPAVLVWYGALRSRIHPAIAGVITARLLPTRGRADEPGESPARWLESRLHPGVAFAIMPLFAVASAGVDLRAVSLSSASDVAFGIVAVLSASALAALATLLVGWMVLRSSRISTPAWVTIDGRPAVFGKESP